MSLKKSLFVALIAGSAIALTANSSYAFFGRHHGSCGSWGGSRGSWGSHGSHGSWGGSGGSWGGSGGSWGGGSCGSHGGGYSYYGGYGYGGYAVVSRPAVRVVDATPVVKTKLTLRVPAEAKVTLAGVETKQSGEVRQFATSRLTSGEVWKDYKVVVEMNRDGQTVREERTIRLTGGQDQELAVDFDSTPTDQVAAR
jgi:uncharacterized protein (TIGR03000 family)